MMNLMNGITIFLRYNNPLADAIIDRIAITAIASTSQALMPNITSPCVRSMVWTKHYKNKLA